MIYYIEHGIKFTDWCQYEPNTRVITKWRKPNSKLVPEFNGDYYLFTDHLNEQRYRIYRPNDIL